MAGSINDLIPEDLSPESEEKIRELVKRKMKGACGMLVRVIRLMEEHYGPDVKDIIHDAIMQKTPRPEAELGPPEELKEPIDRGLRGEVESSRPE